MLTDEEVHRVFKDLGLETQADRDRFLFASGNPRYGVSDFPERFLTTDTADVETWTEAAECRPTGANS